MRFIFTTVVASLGVLLVKAGFDVSDLLFRPNMMADKELMDHAKNIHREPIFTTQAEESLEIEIDLCEEGNFREIFQNLTYSPDWYQRYKGLDHTALFASSVTLSDKYAVIGSNGYDIFKGIVHVYVPKTASKWSLQSLIRSPVWDNANFGNDVSVDDERMVVSANAYEKYDGIVFVYERNLEHQCWLLTGTIKSPLANQTRSQGFGYRVDMSGNFLIASTSVNNAYIFKEVEPGNWTLHTALEPPALDIYFGRSVAIDNDIAVVGAYGYDQNVGRVFVYKHDAQNDTWNLMEELAPLRNQSSFGFSVDMQGSSLIVGANGFYKGEFGNHRSFGARNSQPLVNDGWAYVYQLAPNRSMYLLDAEIASPVGNNSYFGSGVGIYGDSIVVGADGYPCFGLTGAGFVYHKGEDGWTLHQAYPSPAGPDGHFGYAVDINANYSAIGAYGFDELRGAIYLAERDPYNYTPIIPSPTMSPTQPADTLSGGGLNKPVGKSGLTLGMILALALGALIVAGSAGLLIYCCCCMVPIIPVLKKKKKKEEEDESPYTVHSYAGYVEEEFYVPPVVAVDEDIKKDIKKEKEVTFMENGEVRKMFPYKVYGPRGYSEGNNDNVPEDLLTQLKEEDSVVGGKSVGGKSVETHYEDSDERVAKKMSAEDDLPRPFHRPVQSTERHESFNSHQSGYSDHRVSLVDRARNSYETNYGPSDHHSEDNDAMHSMSSLTSQSFHPVPARMSQKYSVSSMSASHKSDTVGDNDDDTVMSGATEITSKSTGSLVNAARERYRRQFSQEKMQATTTVINNHSSLVASIKEGYASSLGRSREGDADSSSVVSSSDHTIGSASSFVNAAKEKYARLQSQATSRGGTSYAAGSSEHGTSLVDRLKARGAAMSETATFVTGSEANTAHVSAARDRYASLQKGIASSSADHDDDDGVTVSTRTSQQSGGSGSVVDAIKARYAKMRSSDSEPGQSSRVGDSSLGSSLVGQVKARYHASLRSESGAASSTVSGEDQFTAASSQVDDRHDDDESTVATRSSVSSQVETARAKYAKLRERREHDLGSVSSGSQVSQQSLVEAARKRGEALKLQSTATYSESDARSVSMQSESQQSSAAESSDASYMVSAIKSRYAASKQQHTSTNHSVISSSTYTTDATHQQAASDDSVTSSSVNNQSDSQFTRASRFSSSATERDADTQSGIAMSDNASHSSNQSSSQSSSSVATSSVNSARSAAMSKFAFYKAKAEAEAHAKATESQQQNDGQGSEWDSGIKVMLKEAVTPGRLRAVESEWTMDDASEGVSQMSVGDDRSSVGDIKARAMAKAREKYARAKELAEQEKASKEVDPARAAGSTVVGQPSAVEVAMQRLRDSRNIPGPSADQLPPPPVFGTTTISHSKASTTTRKVTESSAHTHSVEGDASATLQFSRTSQPSDPSEPNKHV